MREHKKSHLGIMGWAMFLAGAMSLGSCSSDETLESMEPKAITFGSVSMENHSRAADDPSYGNNKLINGFQVWGTVKGNTKNTVNIFNGATIERGSAAYGAAWTQTSGSAQYWIPTADYTFMAVANAKSVTTDAGIPTAIEFELTDGSKDLILSNNVNVKTDASAEPTTGVNNNKCVPFEFTHLLSKVHFTFDGAADIHDIQITGHYGSGTYNISGSTPGWELDEDDIVDDDDSALSFGGIDTDNNGTTSELARLIIPGEQEWTIQLFNSSGDPIGSDIKLNYATTHNGATSPDGKTGFTFEPNTQYNINISLGVDMKLSVSVQDWTVNEIPNDFADDVAVGSQGHIDWTDVDPVYVNAAGQNIQNETTTDITPAASWVVFDQSKTQATFTFQIDGPMGGTWNAMLVTQQGTSEVFQIVKVLKDAEGNEIEEVADMGKVGERYTLRIKTISPNNSDIANKAELRIVVQQGGEILPAHKLMFHGDNHPLNGKNYIMVQNK